MLIILHYSQADSSHVIEELPIRMHEETVLQIRNGCLPILILLLELYNLTLCKKNTMKSLYWYNNLAGSINWVMFHGTAIKTPSNRDMTKYIILLGIFLPPLYSCSQIEGKIQMQRYVFDVNPNGNNFKITTTVWYSGAQSIQEVPTLVMTNDTLGRKVTTKVKYLLFIDSVSKMHLYFQSFSDTAVLVAKSNKADLFSKYGGWDLYSPVEFEYDSMRRMDDTVINGKQLTQYSLLKTKDKDLFNFVVYGLCSDKKLPLIYIPTIARRIGCPIVRMDTYYNGRFTGRIDIKYITGQLSVAEKTVFRAWQQKSK
jgi:hypothetical protein